MRKFIPYREIGELDVLVVDGQHKRCVKLSHWFGANVFDEVAEDSSAGIVLNAIEQGHHSLDRELVSASHYDIDGFTGIWSVFNPEKALPIKDILIHMAKTGDFREFNPEAPNADITLKMVSWMNRIEKEKFYPPFGVSNELSSCTAKFFHFLETFENAFENIENQKNVWEKEYSRVLRDVEIINSNATHIIKIPEIGLAIVKTPEPLHYYAVTGATIGCDTVLSIYSNNRYELEYKYTTWIDMASRPTWPRLKLNLLIEKLNQIEKSDYKWYMDRLADSSPILRLIDQPIPKVIRYDQPYKREIFSSTIGADEIKNHIIDFFKEKYHGITPKPIWKVSELRAINSKL